jgi:hypothetical protein
VRSQIIPKSLSFLANIDERLPKGAELLCTMIGTSVWLHDSTNGSSTVKLDQLITFFSKNPSAKLLGSPHSPYVIFFLHQHFKAEENLATPQSILQQHLNQFLEQVHETEPDVLRDRAESYLTHWSTGDTRWLRRYFDSQHAESVYQLTPHTEDVLKFLNDVLDRTLGFVGTESRLTRIIETLSDIVVRGSDDPQRRLRHLHYHAGHRSH